MFTKLLATGLCVSALSVGATAQIELTTNGDFETGTLDGFNEFPTGGTSSFSITSDAASGDFAGSVINNVSGTAFVIQQSNIGVGQVSPGDEITISFDAKGAGEAGGVQFAEFFSEVAGEGTSATEILGGAPLFPSADEFTTFTFTTLAGPDVSGGVTLQFAVVTGANIGSTSSLIVDNVSVTIVPEPTTAALAGLGGLALLGRRRR